MQRLYNGNPFRMAGVVGGRRDQGEDVVEVSDVWSPGSDKVAQFTIGASGPDHIRG